MYVLITGAAGFVGNRLSQRLLERGDRVVGIDNFNHHYNPLHKRRHAARLARNPLFRLVEGDIHDEARLANICAAEGFDAVVHLAALSGVRNAIRYPALYIHEDFNGTQTVLEVMRAAGIRHCVFASTSSVYGASQQVPFAESDPCDRPLQPYAAAKRSAEILGHAYHHVYGLSFTALRLFNVYGPGGRPDNMVYLTAESIRTGIRLPLYENGEMFRDWTFVDDIVSGIIAAVDRPLGYEVINLGRGEMTRLRDMVDVLQHLAGQAANFEPRPKSEADIVASCADISKARRLLGYAPKVSIREGLAAFWDWYCELPHAELGSHQEGSMA